VPRKRRNPKYLNTAFRSKSMTFNNRSTTFNWLRVPPVQPVLLVLIRQ
jgi:hypothetical protein